MSFPKAKIKRFNDVECVTPSPADYNVASRSNANAATMPKSERFNDGRSPALSECSSVVSSSSATPSTFRTPLPPKRYKAVQKSKPVDLFIKSDDFETLKEKIVEINNKDQYIAELMEQLDELKCKLTACTAASDCAALKTEYEQRIDDLRTEYASSLAAAHDNNAKYVQRVAGHLQEVAEIATNIRHDYNRLNGETSTFLTQIAKVIDLLAADYESLLENYADKCEYVELKAVELHELKKNYLNLKDQLEDVHRLKQRHALEIQAVRCTLLRQMDRICKRNEGERVELQKENAKELRALKDMFVARKESLLKECAAKVAQLEENHREELVLAEMQLKERLNDVQANCRLQLKKQEEESEAILKECQAISEYNIIQTELEKNEIKCKLFAVETTCEELRHACAELTEKNVDLSAKNRQIEEQLTEVAAQLAALKSETDQQIAGHQKSLRASANEKRIYELTITKTHSAIEVLKKRLLHSDHSVEQLKAELEAKETTKVEFESKCSYLLDELQMLYTICEDYETQHKQAINEKVNRVEMALFARIDLLKREASAQIDRMQKQLAINKQLLDETRAQLDAQQRLNGESQALIAKAHLEIVELEEKCAANGNRIVSLETACCELQEELDLCKEHENTVAGENQRLRRTAADHDELCAEITQLRANETHLLERIAQMERKTGASESAATDNHQQLLDRIAALENENTCLNQKVMEQESLIGPFREQLEGYEREYKALIYKAQDAANEAKEMGLKYAEMLGHQNLKQKIKHLRDLKMKNYELASEKKVLEQKVITQTRTIEKLKKDLSAGKSSHKKTKHQHLEDKENYPSPNKTLNSSRTDSPLRDRN